LVDVVLVAALGLAMLYGIAKWRRARHDPGSEHARDRTTKQVYRDG
jgi:hypothetical protein